HVRLLAEHLVRADGRDRRHRDHRRTGDRRGRLRPALEQPDRILPAALPRALRAPADLRDPLRAARPDRPFPASLPPRAAGSRRGRPGGGGSHRRDRRAGGAPGGEMTAVLRAEGLSKRFGGLKANDNVTLSLEKGQILGLIGPNGAGKSTCFAMLAGSIPPTSGRVFLGDEEITGKPAFRVARAG